MVSTGSLRRPAMPRRKLAAPRRWAEALLRSSVGGPYARRQRPLATGYLRRLGALEFAPPEMVARLQAERLRDFLDWACRASAYYGEAARTAGFDPRAVAAPGDLAGFPILTKALLRERAAALLAGGAPLPSWQANASGGSTGEPVRLYQDGDYWNHSQAAQWFMEGWWGVRPGAATALVWGTDRDIHDQTWRQRLGGVLARQRWLNAFAVGSSEMEQFAGMLQRWQPPFIAGYASALHLFARFLLQNPQWAIRPQAVKSTAEVLRPEERAAIERAFDAPVYDFYGSREVNVLAAECPAHAGLHVNTWSRCLELVDGQGRPVPAGVPGRVLVTDLTNRALPLIRYENGDVGVWSGRACPCGRPFPLLERILGRKSDFIHTVSGKLIHGEFFTHLFYAQAGVRAFQVVQDSLQNLRVEVELSGGELELLARELRGPIAAAMGEGVRVDFRRVTAFTRSASGKHHFTRSALELPWPVAGGAAAGETD